jgi:hypothetical protein
MLVLLVALAILFDRLSAVKHMAADRVAPPDEPSVSSR